MCINTDSNLFKNHGAYARHLKMVPFYGIQPMVMQIVSIPDVGFGCNYFISLSHYLKDNPEKQK